MGGQIIDASIVAAPKQRNTDGEKAESGGLHPRSVEGQAGQAAPEGPRCAVDYEVVKSKALR